MEKEHDVIVAARLLAFQALIQNLVRGWGSSREELLTQLRRTKEAMKVSSLNNGCSEPFMNCIDSEFDIVIKSLESAIRELPDSRPDPI
jgi:hypothetical protein